MLVIIILQVIRSGSRLKEMPGRYVLHVWIIKGSDFRLMISTQ